MDKRVLMVATVPSMIGQFNMNNIQILLDMGYKVDVAADFTDTSVWPEDRVQKFRDQMEEMGIECIQLDFSRNPLKIGRHFNSYKETIKLIREREYSFIHTHTPIASAIVRQAAHKTGTKVIYTAHGFHFYKGAPLKNWLIFYPIEKHYSRYTDVLITINKEDYKRAKEHFKAKKVVYIPGVGVDTEKFGISARKDIKKELNIPRDNFLLLSVGELNRNKNHEMIIRAIAGKRNITYLIAGTGELDKQLRTMAKEKNVALVLAGYQPNISDFYSAADIYILPSLREGLNVSLMEAMASGLPCLAGNIRGNVDLIDENGGYLFDPNDPTDIKSAVEKMMSLSKEERRAMGKYNAEKMKAFDLHSVESVVSEIYRGGL